MNSLLFVLILVVSIAQAAAGTLICNGPKHVIKIDSALNTIEVTPEMKEKRPAIIERGPERDLFVVYDQAETFVVYLAQKNGQMLGNLESTADEDLEEKVICEGSL